MSIRAYRVKKLIYEEVPTFHFWWDEELANFLLGKANKIMGKRPEFLEVKAKVLEEAIETLKPGPEMVDSLRRDIAASTDGFVLYICF